MNPYEREAGVRDQREDVTLLDLKMKGPQAKECRRSLKARKGEERDSSVEPLKETQPL